MEKVSKELLKEIANSLMFDMDETDYQSLVDEFDFILEQFAHISDVMGVNEVAPISFPYEITTSSLREDIIEKPLSKEEVLKNANDVVEGQISLPKVVR